jgi:hypothetical protein
MQVGDDEFGYMLSDILEQNNFHNQDYYLILMLEQRWLL